MGGHAIVSGGHAGPPLQDSRDEKNKMEEGRMDGEAVHSSLLLLPPIGRTVGADCWGGPACPPVTPRKIQFLF